MAGEEEGAGTCGAWLERIQISSQAASVSHPHSLPRGQHRLPHSVMHGERGCDVTMSRVSPGPHCHNVLVTLPRLPRVGRGMGSGGRCGSRAGARRGLGMYRSMTRSHASLEIRAGKHHQPHTCTRQSRGTNHQCAPCVPRIDILFGASESIIGNRLAKSPTPVPGPSLSFSIQTIRSQV